jgi:hypothetical protein
MTKASSPRKRNATLPRTTHDKREYMRHQANESGKTLIEYVEDKAAPQRKVNAFVKARNKINDQTSKQP